MSLGTGIAPSPQDMARYLWIEGYGSASVTVGAVTSGSTATGTISLTNGTCAVGDIAIIAPGSDAKAMILTAYVNAANTVTWVVYNPTGGTVTMTAATTWYVYTAPKFTGQGTTT